MPSADHSSSFYKRRAALWLVVIAVFLGLLIGQFVAGKVRIETDLLRLLPDTALPAETNAALREVEKVTTDQFVLYVVGSELEKTAQLAQQIRRQIEPLAVVESLEFQRLNTQNELLAALKKGRYSLLSEVDKDRLEQQPNRLVKQAVRRLYQPVGSNPIASFEEDPLGLFVNYLQALPKPVSGTGWVPLQVEGVPVIQHPSHTVLPAYPDGFYSVALYGFLADKPFKPEVQDSLEAAITQAKSELPTGYQLVHSGAVFHIAVATRQARYEMSTIGIGSLLGITLLLAFAFRAASPIALSICAIGQGILCATVVTIALFGEIHALTLVFGASLTGMSIDYAFHYFAAPAREQGKNRIQQVMPGITIGVITSVIAFLCLLLAPFPGLQQMAVFAAVGLTTAYGCVVCIYPAISGWLHEPNATALQLSTRLHSGPQYILNKLLQQRVLSVVLASVLVLVTIAGLVQLRPNDDIRLLYQPTGELARMEQIAFDLQRDKIDRRMLLLSGADGAELQQLEAQVREQLTGLQQQQAIAQFLSFGVYLPTPDQQAEYYALQQKVIYADGGLLEKLAQTLDLDAAWLAQQRQQFSEAADTPLQLQRLAADYPDSFGHFWVQPELASDSGSDSDQDSGQVFTIVALLGINDATPLEQLASQMPNVEYIDRVAMTSATFKKYRAMSLGFTVLAYSLILVLLLLRYKWRLALRIFAGPFSAAVITLAALGWAGATINLFTAFALIVVLGVGIDYAVFFAESGKRSAHTMLAVGLSATTTVLAFGLLALSDTPALNTFGLTLWVGITLAFLLAPLLASDAGHTTRQSHAHE